MLSRFVKMQLDNLPLLVPNGRRPWQGHQEKFELFNLQRCTTECVAQSTRRKLLLTLYLILLSKREIASSWYQSVCWKFSFANPWRNQSWRRRIKCCSYYFAQPAALNIRSRNNLFTAASYFTMWSLRAYLIFARRAARRSVFWKRALTNCFTCSPGTSLARGPWVICDVVKNIEYVMLVPDPPPNGLQFLWGWH